VDVATFKTVDDSLTESSLFPVHVISDLHDFIVCLFADKGYKWGLLLFDTENNCRDIVIQNYFVQLSANQ